ncbi:uncharacterized protein [Miscanthus floridulus]|uniref:uncharacterized protein n=1 Tax=Miscanthus floridulus TaxID=154761 RepID=UPI0034589BD4
MVQLNVMPQLHPVPEANEKYTLSTACFNLTLDEKRAILFLPIAIRAIKPEFLKMDITRMCYFFSKIPQKMIGKQELSDLHEFMIQALGSCYLHEIWSYERFMSVLSRYVHNVKDGAFRFYVINNHGRHDPARKEKLAIKILCACPKQKHESVQCGDYICSMMSNTGAYRRHPLRKTAAAISPGFEVVVRVPPSDLLDNLRRLLQEKQGADVTFKVRDEVFPAHKIILAMRPPVFSAEFFGPVAVAAESTSQCVTIEDMHPDVFRALLHFVYTDTMPAMDELDAGERKEMLRHLLVAADRYAMERLKLMCEASLCESICVDDVADMAALADRHRGEALGHACAEFIASSNENEIGDVVASQGYVHLKKKKCPAVLVDMFEKVTLWLCA